MRRNGRAVDNPPYQGVTREEIALIIARLNEVTRQLEELIRLERERCARAKPNAER